MRKILTVIVIILSVFELNAQSAFPLYDGFFGPKNGSSDGRIRGFRVWDTDDTNHVIYSAASSGISPAGNNAPDGLWNTGHRMRFRTYYSNQGFLFENNAESSLVDIDGGNGNLKSIGIAHFLGSGSNYFAGSIGVGTISPTSTLEVNGSFKVSNFFQLTDNGRISGNLIFSQGVDTNAGIIRGSGSGTSGGGLEFLTIDGNWVWQVRAVIDPQGNMGIGTNTPDSKLTVKGDIHAEEVTVDLSVPGPDYVFEEDYELTTLEETESYIKANKHLPEIPSAKEMEEQGIDLGMMNMLLLKKIEELTLHVIELSEQSDKQQQEINKLKYSNEYR